jgi:uncharacterized protein
VQRDLQTCGMAFWTWKNIAGLLLLPVVLYLILRLYEQKLTFAPASRHEADPGSQGRSFEEVWLTASDGVRLHAWFFPALPSSPRRHLAFLICHGNGGNISHRLALIDTLLDLGANVFIFDYRGYGKSAGWPGENGTYRDAEAAHSWLQTRGIAATNMIAYGESLGGAVATELAVRQPLGGLILQSTFTSLPDLGQELLPWLPVRALAHYRYDTRGKLPNLGLPVLILHGRADSLIPYSHAERNFAVANEPKLLWELAGDHNDQPGVDPARFKEGLERFLGTSESTPRPIVAPNR